MQLLRGHIEGSKRWKSQAFVHWFFQPILNEYDYICQHYERCREFNDEKHSVHWFMIPQLAVWWCIVVETNLESIITHPLQNSAVNKQYLERQIYWCDTRKKIPAVFQKSTVFKFYFNYKSNVLIKEKLGDTCSFKGKNNLLSHYIDINHLYVSLDFSNAQCPGNAYNTNGPIPYMSFIVWFLSF